jgi:type III secretion system FlhB-like substrate exporter
MSTEEHDHRKLAIALEYERGSRQAPRVTAKGYGYVAEAIIALARENDIVIEANPLLADALAGVALDDTIPIELYEAVAEVIGLVLRARNRIVADPDATS